MMDKERLGTATDWRRLNKDKTKGRVGTWSGSRNRKRSSEGKKKKERIQIIHSLINSITTNANFLV